MDQPNNPVELTAHHAGFLGYSLHLRLWAAAHRERSAARMTTMKAYIGIKFHPDNRNRATIELISQLLAACGFETVCIRRDLEQWGAVQLSPEALMHQTCAVIEACDLVVIELTEKGVGLGIEAGYAYAHGRPVITIARAGADISTTLRGISSAICLYESTEELQAFFSQMRRVLTNASLGAQGDGMPGNIRRGAKRST